MMKVKINNKEYDIKKYPYKMYSGEFTIDIPLSDCKYFRDWYNLLYDNSGRCLLKKDCVKDIEMITDIPNIKNGKYVNCLIKSMSFDWIYELLPFATVEIIYDAFEEQKPKEINIELIPIVIPEGKKLVKTELESGLLLTFEDKNIYQKHIDDLEYLKEQIFKSLGIRKNLYWGNTPTYKQESNLTPLEIIEKYFLIYDSKQDKYVPFILMPHQKRILKSLEENNGTIVKQYRQAGVTALQSAYAATQMILNNTTNIILFEAKLRNGKHFIDLVRNFIYQYSKEAYGEKFNPFLISSTGSLVTRNGSKIEYFSSTNENQFRGYDEDFFKSVTHIIIDNAAWVELSLVIQGIVDYRLTNNIKVSISSTDTWEDNLFKINWKQGKFVNTNLNKIELNWFEDPRFNEDLKWIKIENKEIKNGFYKTNYSYIPSSPWFTETCRRFVNNKYRIEQEIGVGYDPNEDHTETEKLEIRNQILELNKKLRSYKNE